MWHKMTSVKATSKLVIATSVCIAAMTQVAWAGVFNAPDLSLLPTTAEPVLLASTSFVATGLPETGDQLANAILPSEDIPRASLLIQSSDLPNLQPVKKIAEPEKTIEQRMAEVQSQRAGFTLNGLFRGSGDSSLGSLFLGMAIIGIVVGGIRLEILRRRAEKSAFYGADLVKHRSHRQRSTVIYVDTGHSTSKRRASSGSSNGSRRRRRRSSHSGHASDGGRHRSYASTHPVIVEGRLAG